MPVAPVLSILGILVAAMGVLMLLPAGLALYYGEEDLFAHLAASLLTTALGALLHILSKSRSSERLHHKQAFAIVALGWFAAGFAGGVPYYFYAHLPRPFFADAPGALPVPQCPRNDANPASDFCSYVDCVFESTSGFTTTGATIVVSGLWKTPEKREGLPHGILFWRALTHWLGGMGIVLLGLAVFPLLGVGGMDLYRAEVPGPTSDKLTPRVTETAKLLWGLYAALTLAEVVLLLPRMDLFQATTHAFATMATGGFSTLGESVGGFHDPYVEYVVTLFMFLAGANFALHYLAFVRLRFSVFVKNSEFVTYTLIILASSIIAAISLTGYSGWDAEEAFRKAVFQVTSIVTTTGFVSTDFEKWLAPASTVSLAGFILLVVMFIGGSAGSTGGGPKVSRYILMAKAAWRELLLLIHPKAALSVRYEGRPVRESIIRATVGFFFLYFLAFAVGSMVVAAYGYDQITSITTSIATLGNIGPGYGNVGAMDNYSHFPAVVKSILIVLMIMGRLEVYTVLVLLVPEFWRR